MPIFSRQELEALLDKCENLPNAELKRRGGSVAANGTARWPLSVGARSQSDATGVVAMATFAENLRLVQ